MVDTKLLGNDILSMKFEWYERRSSKATNYCYGVKCIRKCDYLVKNKIKKCIEKISIHIASSVPSAAFLR